MRQTPPESGRNDPEKKKIELPGSEATGAKQNRWILLLVFLPCFVLMLHMNNDLWFLLNSGRYVLQHGIPTIEPFTLHQNFSFVMQQWLTAGIFWVVYSKLGAVGILALVFLLYCALSPSSARSAGISRAEMCLRRFLGVYYPPQCSSW